jgi:hypothetical protein
VGSAIVIHLWPDRDTLSLQLRADPQDDVRVVAPRVPSLEPTPSPTVGNDERDQAKQGAGRRARCTRQTHEAADAVSDAGTGEAEQRDRRPPDRVEPHATKQPRPDTTPAPW